MKILKVTLAAAMLASAAIAVPAVAAPIIKFTPGASVSGTAGYTVVQNFDTANILGNYTGLSGNYQILTGNTPNVGTQPNTSGTPYLAVLGGNSATYTFGTAVSGLAFDWGTASIENTLTLTDINSVSTTFQVSTLASNAVNGLLVATANGAAIKSLTFGTTANSFEADNIAAAVPEPAAWGMMILGFGVVGAAMRRRRAPVVRFA